MVLNSIKYKEFLPGYKVEFVTNIGTLDGVIRESSGKYYISLLGTVSNNHIFEEINNSRYSSFSDFVYSVVGYHSGGAWPEAKSLDDLRRVLDALLIFGKVKSKEAKTIEIRKHKIKLNFSL